MHILIPVLHRPTKPTGVCRHAANLARCLDDLEAVTQITVVTGAWQKHYFETSFDLGSEKIKLVGIDIKNSSLSRNLWFLLGLPKLAQQLKPDLIHLSFPFPFIRPWFGCPVVSTLHDLYPYECPENFGFPQVWFNRFFLSQCIRSSDGIACVSAITLGALQQYFGSVLSQKKTAVVYNYVDFSGIETSPPRINDDAASGDGAKTTGLMTPDTRFLMSVAQHRKNKNLNYLIQAYSALRQKGIIDLTTQLIIVGSPGPESEALKALIQTLELEQQVLLLSSIGDDQLCWLYKHCELFVIPSSTEGFCIPLVEALSLGAKAVCSDLPIFQEVGGPSGCYFFKLDSDNINNLTTAMSTALLQTPTAVTSIDQRFTKEAVGQAYGQFYQLVSESLA